jgi:glucose-6-phosphate isomerase
MMSQLENSWSHFSARSSVCSRTGVTVDLSRIGLGDSELSEYCKAFPGVLAAMASLEGGSIANPDEGRMVGHYWLRNSSLAPTSQIRDEIFVTLERLSSFVAGIHAGRLSSPSGAPFDSLLSIGIGGSSLGPMFIAEALGTGADRLVPYFLDNTDPDGFERMFARLGDRLSTTLVLVISKSGGTPETFNGMLAVQAEFRRRGLNFARQAVAVTGVDSALDRQALAEGWLERFPMWDWVGGRTSVMSAVGILPAALQGIDVGHLLSGASLMDESTRSQDWRTNPALALAMAWHHCGDGRGSKDMVILPYKDRLALFSRYLQQLIMESLGKELDLSGKVVHQGIAVYGNKGSTDQHAYVQQLRDGLNNFFVTFIVSLKERFEGRSSDLVAASPSSGDYLSGFWMGTREALTESGRQSILVTIPEVSALTVGALIALYERAVGFYATLIQVNAYHQPGVEAGKQAAQSILDLQQKVVGYLISGSDAQTVEQIAAALGAKTELVYHVLEHLSANGKFGLVSDLNDSIERRLFRVVAAE